MYIAFRDIEDVMLYKREISFFQMRVNFYSQRRYKDEDVIRLNVHFILHLGV